jgi:outer membrane protein TolC
MLTKRLYLSLCSIGLVVVAAWAIAAEPPAPQQSAASHPLQSLLKERVDTLRHLVEILDAQSQSGVVTKETVILASNQLLDAELELAKTKADRVALHEKLVGNLRRLEEFANGQYRDGRCTLDGPLRAKAARLKAEIQLLREKGQ